MTVILPGSYDPVTLGHLDIIRRAAEKYDRVLVVAFINPEKHYRFTPKERVDMLKIATRDIPNVAVDYSEGLVVDYMRAAGATLIVKGYRNDTDLAYERDMARINRELGGYDTELIRCNTGYEQISSTAARHAMDRGADTDALLPREVAEYISALTDI